MDVLPQAAHYLEKALRMQEELHCTTRGKETLIPPTNTVPINCGFAVVNNFLFVCLGGGGVYPNAKSSLLSAQCYASVN